MGAVVIYHQDIVCLRITIRRVSDPTIPSANADGEVFHATAHAMNMSQETLGQSDPSMDTLPRWSSNFFVHMNTFSYPDEKDGHKLIGLSGRGNQIIGTWETQGSGSNILPLLFMKSKSVLRVGASKMVELVL